MTKDQRLHREPDPRVRRSLVVALATSALLVAGALTVVGVRAPGIEAGLMKSSSTRRNALQLIVAPPLARTSSAAFAERGRRAP